MSNTNQSIIKLQVETENLIGNLRYTFATASSMVKELLQNSRRAGATLITLDLDLEQSYIRITDDGCGIDDFSKLLKVSKSGWSDDVKKAEAAFGMGWLSCLFNAERVEVKSKGQSISFCTKDALEFSELAVEQVSDADKLTTITLYGVDDVFKSLETNGMKHLKGMESILKALSDIVVGFPVKLLVNGIEAESTFAVGSSKFTWVDLDIGKVGYTQKFLDYFLGGQSVDAVCFLQGFSIARLKIADKWHSWSSELCVHLDGNQYFGRMADRDQLHNKDICEKAILQCLINWLKDMALSDKKSMSEPEWICKYHSVRYTLGLSEYFTNSDYVPVTLFSKWKDDVYSYMLGTHGIDDVTDICSIETVPSVIVESGCVSRKLVEKTNTKFLARPNYFSVSSQWSLIHAICVEHGMVMVDESDFHDEHWMNQYLISIDEYFIEGTAEAEENMVADDQLISFVLDDDAKSDVFHGDCSSGNVIMTKTVTVKIGDKADFLLAKECFVVYQNYYLQSAYVFSEKDSHLAHSLTCYTDNDNFVNALFDRDEYLFGMFLRTLSGHDIQTLFKLFLNDSIGAFPGISVLSGKSVTLNFDLTGCSVEEVSIA